MEVQYVCMDQYEYAYTYFSMPTESSVAMSIPSHQILLSKFYHPVRPLQQLQLQGPDQGSKGMKKNQHGHMDACTEGKAWIECLWAF